MTQSDEDHIYRLKEAPQEISIMADEGLIKQALRILTDNASKYTKKGEEIILGTGMTENGRPYFRVQDSGIGMKERDVKHMFDRFYRSDEARSYEGTGLGRILPLISLKLYLALEDLPSEGCYNGGGAPVPGAYYREVR